MFSICLMSKSASYSQVNHLALIYKCKSKFQGANGSDGISGSLLASCLPTPYFRRTCCFIRCLINSYEGDLKGCLTNPYFRFLDGHP